MQEFPIPFMIFQHFIRMIEHILFSNIFGFCEWEYIRFKKFLKTFPVKFIYEKMHNRDHRIIDTNKFDEYNSMVK